MHYNHAEIEVSLDRGEIRHDKQKLAIYESLNLNLKKGAIANFIQFIQPWVKQYDLWLDVRSKAQRGDCLTQNLKTTTVQFAAPLQLIDKTLPMPH